MRILFDPFPAVGHTNAFLRLAELLNQDSVEKLFVGPLESSTSVIKKSYNYHVLNPFPVLTKKMRVKTIGWGEYILEFLGGKQKKILKSELAKSILEYEQIIYSFKPDIVFLDDHYSQKAYIYHHLNIPVIRVQTMISPYRQKGIPPFQSYLVPNSSFRRFSSDVLWIVNRIHKQIWKAIDTPGFTDTDIYRSFFGRTLFTEKNRCFGTGLKKFPVIITSPKSFDFLPFSATNINNVALNRSDLVHVQDSRLISILERTASSKSPLIYCSLGTVTKEFERSIKLFFKKVLMTSLEFSNAHFVLSVSPSFDPSWLGQIPRNVSVFRKVDQQAILKYANMMITHGGHNSVMECIDHEVPMIVVPLSTNWDQPGVSARVVFHKMGIRLKLRWISKLRLKNAINQLLSEESRYRRNLKMMKQRIERETKQAKTEVNRIISMNVTLDRRRTI